MVEIVVNGISLDVSQSEVLSLTMAINDLAKLEESQGDYSNTFNVPATDHNLNALGYVNDLNISTAVTNANLDAQLKQDGAIFRSGFISIDNYDSDKGLIGLDFYSGNVSWFDLIKDKSLRDVDLSEYNHDFTFANVINSFTRTTGYIYPLINYGRITPKNSWTMSIYDFMPATFVHNIVENLFKDIGYKIAGSFINSSIYKRLLLPYAKKEGTFIDVEAYANNRVEAINPADQVFKPAPNTHTIVDTSTIINNTNINGLYNTGTNRYTSNYWGMVGYEGTVTMTINDSLTSSQLPSLTVLKNGTAIPSIVKTDFSLFFGNIYTASIHVTADAQPAWNNSAVNGDYFEMTVFYPNGSPVLSSNFTITSANLTYVAAKPYNEYSEISLQATLPDLEQKELLSTLFNQFGVVVQENIATKTVEMNFFNDIKKNIANAVDWSDKIDIETKPKLDFAKLLSGYAVNNHFKYSEADEDILLEGFNEIHGKRKGDGTLVVDADGIDIEKDMFTSKFSPTVNFPSFQDASGNGAMLPYIPRYSSDVIDALEPDVDPKPRMLILAGEYLIGEFVPNLLITVTYNNDVDSQNVLAAPYAYFSKGIISENIDRLRDSLVFSQDPVNGSRENALLDTYYGDYIDILNNPKMLSIYVDLNPIDIHNLDFFKPVYLSQYNAYFYINKIDEYRAGNESTKVELIKIQ